MVTSGSTFWKRYRKNGLVVAGSLFLLIIVIVAVLIPSIDSLDPFTFSKFLYTPPSSTNPMGTDNLGRSVLARVLWGTRSALVVGLGSAFLSALIGAYLGAIGGYFGGITDSIVMRATDIMLALPTFFLVLLAGYIWGGSIYVVTLILGFTIWPGTARLVRAEVLTLRQRGFVEASRAIGVSDVYLLAREIFPNAVHPAIAMISLNAAWSILAETGLSFLGLHDPSVITWGWLLNESLVHYNQAWWMAIFPGIAVSLLVLSFNLVGDGINDALNPRIREGRVVKPIRKSIKLKSKTQGCIKGLTKDLLSIHNLSIDFPVGNLVARVVDDISFRIMPSEVVGLVGESGSGKTMTALSIVGLLPLPGYISEGQVCFVNEDLRLASSERMRKLRYSEIAMSFQDPLSSLNPVMKVGDQIAEPLIVELGLSRRDAFDRAIEIMKKLSINAAPERANNYPHQLSGGMRQRILLAVSIIRQPKLLIIDEPTTALDVITQSEVLDLIRGPISSSGAGILLITHNMGVVAETCNRILLMYAGQIVENGPTEKVLSNPLHPYTQGLISSLPTLDDHQEKLYAIPGSVPDALNFPQGCRFHPRCPHVMQVCSAQVPQMEWIEENRQVACWLYKPSPHVEGVKNADKF